MVTTASGSAAEFVRALILVASWLPTVARPVPPSRLKSGSPSQTADPNAKCPPAAARGPVISGPASVKLLPRWIAEPSWLSSQYRLSG